MVKPVRGIFNCIFVSIVTFISIVPNDTSGADVYVEEPRILGDGTMIDEGLTIRGEISVGDYDSMIKSIKNAGRIPGFLRINSAGGDVVEAMKIGQFVRDSLMSVIAGGDRKLGSDRNDSAVCNSSCFLILAAGTRRYTRVPVGIHRPYYDREYFAGLSPTDAEKKYKELDSIVRDYSVRMDIPQAVNDRMMSIKSTNVEFLNYSQISLDWDDAPALEEWLIAKCGSLSDSESFDIHSISEAREVEPMKRMMSKELDPAERAKYQFFIDESERSVRYVSRLSEGYKSYLIEKNQKIGNCAETAVEDHRQEMFNNLR